MALRKTTLSVGVDRETVAKLNLRVLREEEGRKTVIVDDIPNVIDLDSPTAKSGVPAVDSDLDDLLASGLVSRAQVAYDAVLMYRTRIGNDRREEIKGGEAKRVEREAREANGKALMARIEDGSATDADKAELMRLILSKK